MSYTDLLHILYLHIFYITSAYSGFFIIDDTKAVKELRTEADRTEADDTIMSLDYFPYDKLQ